jgi:hypothetical protein
LKRRTFVYLTIAGAAAFITPFSACRQTTESLTKTLGTPDLLASLLDDKTVREIGSLYRVRVSDEAPQDKLVAALLASVGGRQNQSNSEAERAGLVQKLNNAVRNDFANGQIITIKGWVLSQTEARQCALYSLSKQ